MNIKYNLKNNKFKKKSKEILISCEICSSKKYFVLQEVGRIGSPGEYGFLKTVICKKCSFKFLNPRYVDKFYTKYYKKNYRKIAFGSYVPSKYYVETQKKRGLGVLNFFKNKIKKGSMLDHGCASGATMLPWLKSGWECYGIDPHVPSVKYGRYKYKLNIKIAFGEQLPFKDSLFDTILSLGSLEHAYDLSKTMLEIKRTLKNNGNLIIRWRSNKIIGSPLEYYNHNHNRFFTRLTLKALLNKYGFKVLDFVEKPLEGYNSYQYILAKKINNNFNIKYVLKKLNLKKQVKKEIDNYKKVLKKYTSIVLDIKKLNLFDDFKKKDRLIYIEKNNVKLLGIKKKDAISRYFYEIKKYYEILKK